MAGIKDVTLRRWVGNCSPHPLDIMAIYALYQTLKPLDEQE